MGYQQALEATGVEVKEFKEFGSYQGDWFALLADGRIVSGSYGSCSGCDAFQAEFSYSDERPGFRDGKYYENEYDWCDTEITKEEYEAKTTDLDTRLCAFGQSYMNGAETLDEAIARYEIKAVEEYAWDDDREILEWLKSLKNN